MIDPKDYARYSLSEDLDSVCQEIITWLSDSYPEIYLIHQESYGDRSQISSRLTLFHRRWGPTFILEIIPIDSPQTLIFIAMPPDPGLEDVNTYRAKILENLSVDAAAIRLALAERDEESAASMMRDVLSEQRLQCWIQIHSGLIRSLQLETYEGDLDEFNRDIPNDTGNNKPVEYAPSQDESLVLDLWAKGYTAKQIALRTSRTEKTILNRLTLMRKVYGEQLVPRRRMA